MFGHFRLGDHRRGLVDDQFHAALPIGNGTRDGVGAHHRFGAAHRRDGGRRIGEAQPKQAGLGEV